MTKKCSRPACQNRAEPSRLHGYCKKHAEHYGIFRPRPGREKSMKSLRRWTEAGFSTHQISKHTGIARNTLTEFINGNTRSLSAAKVELLDTTVMPHSAEKNPPSWPIARRIRALVALGWKYPQLAELCQMDENYLCCIARKRDRGRVSMETDRKVRAMYERLSPHPAPQSPKLQVLRNGWPTPLAWDDIDDPDENPTGISSPVVGDKKYGPATKRLKERIEALVEFYGSEYACARALNTSRSTLHSLRGPGKQVGVNLRTRIHRHYRKRCLQPNYARKETC